MDRRRFFQTTGALLLTGTAGHLIEGSSPSLAETGTGDGAVDVRGLPPSGAMDPVYQVERTVAAFADTVIPGPADDPDRGPGALDAYALNMMYDQFYPFYEMVPGIVMFLDQTAQRVAGADFADCTFEQRTEALLEVVDEVPYFQLGMQFVKMAFYGGIYNTVGTDYVGFPGSSRGYTDYSYGASPLSEEATEHGYLP